MIVNAFFNFFLKKIMEVGGVEPPSLN